MSKVYFQILIICLTLVVSQPSYGGKKQCQSYLDKLRNIQSLQKQGYSLKRGEILNKREIRARKKWWQCERGLLKKNKSSKKKKKKQNKKNKVKMAQAKLQHFSVNLPSNSSKRNTEKRTVKPLQRSASVVVKSKYQGKKLQAWLQYYQQPKRCFRPKSTKQFAFCVEDRRAQQLTFEQAFDKNDVTVSIK